MRILATFLMCFLSLRCLAMGTPAPEYHYLALVNKQIRTSSLQANRTIRLPKVTPLNYQKLDILDKQNPRSKQS